ncbi:hypothetical protein GHT06_022066 [Daphnia sinensis]|uniref:Uncharacterized protein n=1 Tax=Daphnia sinensis TaxID=1820382 RepID=A0AAD5PQN9_9CRUS|nr:hypothetical protein GHT06_022066 [Daphnia sinensis]
MSLDVSRQILEIPALGRNFKLGGLYDSRNDQLLPGFSLWNITELKAPYLDVTHQNRTSYDLFAADKLSEKLQKLEVNGSLQLSILAGLIKLNGSASFINEKKNTHRESSIHVRCHHGTLVKSLTMDHLGKDKITHLDIAKSGANNLATHVVTQIKYGAGATFTFRKRINQEEDKQSAKGKLELCGNALIKVLGGSLAGQGDGENVNLDNDNDTGIECQFEGDFIIPSDFNTPTTYEEAIKFAGRFNHVLSQSITKDAEFGNEPLGLPCTVTLYPLVKLPGAEDAPIHKNQISDILASQCVRLMEAYEEMEEKLDDLLDDSLGSEIRPFRKKLERFREQFTSFRVNLMLKLGELLVKIRSGEHDVASLQQFLDRIRDEQFVFHPDRIGSWLGEKHEELCMAKRFKDKLTAQLVDNDEGRILIFATERKIREHTMASSVRHAVHFVLTSMASPEFFLQLTGRYLDQGDTSGNAPAVGKEQKWYRDHKVVTHIEEEMSDYIEFVKANKDDEEIVFAMTVLDVHDEECASGSSVFVYENGIMVRKNYELPGIPRSVNIEWDDDSNQIITFLAPTKGEIRRYRIDRTENFEHSSSFVEDPFFVLPLETVLAMMDCEQMEMTVTAECLYGSGPPYKVSILAPYTRTSLEW